MRIKKTVTEKVIAANRTNGRKNTGPQNTNSVRENARRHGLLSRMLVFQTEEEKEELNTLLAELHDEYRPVGRTNQE